MTMKIAVLAFAALRGVVFMVSSPKLVVPSQDDLDAAHGFHELQGLR
jgi:hypothetical protein